MSFLVVVAYGPRFENHCYGLCPIRVGPMKHSGNMDECINIEINGGWGKEVGEVKVTQVVGNKMSKFSLCLCY